MVKSKKVLAVLLALSIIFSTLCAVPIIAEASENENSATYCDDNVKEVAFWADPENCITAVDTAGTDAMLGAVQAQTISSSGSEYFLFLPSTTDLSNLKLWFSASNAAIDGTAITSGEPTNIFAGADSAVQSHSLSLGGTSYTLKVIKSGDVGTVYVDTSSGTMAKIHASNDKSVKESGKIMVVQPNGTVDYCGVLTSIGGRGNGTWDSNGKRPYNIKLAVSTNLLGMGKAKKWNLLANAGDDTFVKNQLTYDFSKEIGINYQVICKPVDLYCNEHYMGAYQLSQKVEIKSNRVNLATDAYEELQYANGTVDSTTGITTPADFSTWTNLTNVYKDIDNKDVTLTTGTNVPYTYTPGSRKYQAIKASTPTGDPTNLIDPADITGGYIYELEISNRWCNENAGCVGYNRQGWAIKSCDYINRHMVDYNYKLLYALGGAVYNGGTVPSTSITTTCSKLSSLTIGLYGSKSVTNPAPDAAYQGKKWSDLLDADSAVRYYWTQEYFKNMDSSTSSTYFYKESDSIDSKLYAGPVWDMDNSICYDGNASRWGCSYTSSTGWYTKSSRIYRWRSGDSTTTYSTDDHSPLNFYAALATNCSDFWTMAGEYWYKYISPATKILLGESPETETLKSVATYVNTVAKSAQMNCVRYNNSNFDAASVISGMTTWLSERNAFINGEISRVDISGAGISTIPTQTYTGSEITPSFTVTYNGTQLTEGVDYTVSYSNNINAGSSGSVTLTGIGYYTGTKSDTFKINLANLSNCTGKLYDIAYAGDTIPAIVIDSNGNTVTGSMTYQWYADGTELTGETASEYVVTAADAGKSLTFTATGDNKNVYGSVTSNACSVASTERPSGIVATIASWDYDYSSNKSALTNADTTGTSYYYTATGGVQKDTAPLRASVNTVSTSEIKWSGADTYSKTDGTSDQAPITGTSKTAGISWGEYPYFETEVSTVGYANITFSACLGGTKKAPRDWKLQYSLDGGSTFTDVTDATYSIATNKTLEQAFSNVALPSECNEQSSVIIRMVVTSDTTIGLTTGLIGSTSGDAAVNNIVVKGNQTAQINELSAPEFSIESGSTIYGTDLLAITDTNGGANVYYSLTYNSAQGTEELYSAPFSVFAPYSMLTCGETVTVSAYAKHDIIQSPVATATYTYGGDLLNEFSYSDYSTEVFNGAVFSTGGVFGESATMTATADSTSLYVPIWTKSAKSFAVSPDDGNLWSEDSGFTYKISTSGYKNIKFSCDAYSTQQGPKSTSLLVSTDNSSWTTVESNKALPASGVLEAYYTEYTLPSSCDNQAVVYVKLATTENLTNSGVALHNNNSKGNLYVNNVTFSGEQNGSLIMPYTNKTTDMFGLTGVIKYYNPNSASTTMRYSVADESGNVVLSGIYPETGISIPSAKGFSNAAQEKYKVSVWAEEDEDSSAVNVRTYCYKGTTFAQFDYDDTTFANFTNDFSTEISASVGTGTLAMYPNGSSAATLTYTSKYGVRASASTSNSWAASKVIDNPASNGYWLIKTSTKNYKNISINLDQLSSNKGPRDWGLAYSIDGTNFTFISNSNVRTISNDSVAKAVETYGNFALPQECNDLDTLYLKVFINGGENIEGYELDDALNAVGIGNTGISNIEISGIPDITETNFTLTTVVAETPDAVTGSHALSGVQVFVNSELVATSDASGNVSFTLPVSDTDYEIVLSYPQGFDRTITATANSSDISLGAVPIVAVDLNNDGFINSRDYAMLLQMSDEAEKEYLKPVMKAFFTISETDFVYA